METSNRQERITTPCPSCGAESLFIGNGGGLTCAVLGCKSPSVAATIEGLKKHQQTLAEYSSDWDAIRRTPSVWRAGDGTYHESLLRSFRALDQVRQMLKRDDSAVTVLQFIDFVGRGEAEPFLCDGPDRHGFVIKGDRS